MANLSPKENNDIAVKFFDGAWNHGRFDESIGTLIAADAEDHSTVGGSFKTEKGIESFRAIVSMFRAAMPDVHLEIADQIYADDRVVHRWVITGTHSNPLMGIPGTGKKITLLGTTIVRMKDGLIVERWANVDELGLLQQLGVVPPPQPPPAH